MLIRSAKSNQKGGHLGPESLLQTPCRGMRPKRNVFAGGNKEVARQPPLSGENEVKKKSETDL